MKALVVVAHGSRDTRSSDTVATVVSRIRSENPQLDVRLGYLDLSSPSVEEVFDSLAAGGVTDAVVTPLLLGRAFHARVDLPELITQSQDRNPRLRITTSAVLGDDPLLIEAVRQRVEQVGASRDDPTVGVVLAAVGSSDEPANELTRGIAAQLCVGTKWNAITCFATSPTPSAAEAVHALTASGSEKLVLAPWFVAPGLLTDRVTAAAVDACPDIAVADVIGDHPLLAELVRRRAG